MNLTPDGYRIVDIPAASEALLASFEDLPLDEYCGGRQRFQRFSQYRLHFADGHWHSELLPHRPLLQSHVYNSKSGNVRRQTPPLQVDATAWIDAALQSGGLDTTRDWHLDINQYRVITTPDIKGITVPEGVHQDGHHYVMIFVFRRHAITGATLRLLPVGGGPAFLETVIEAEQAIILDDRRMLHDASPIEPVGDYGYRDYFGTALNPWEERRYGEEFEAKVLAAAASRRR
jgi:hypothetical protein